jgi:protein-disulfide isomerase
MRNPWVVVGVITVLLFGGAIWYSSSLTEKSNQGVETKANIKGNPEALVKLVEFSDFQCPACASFQPALKELEARYPDQLSLEFKHFPLPMHPYSMQASVATESAGQQGKFFEFHDLLFANQQEWSSSATPGIYFTRYAEQLGLDVELFRDHQKSIILRDKVRKDAQDGRDIGINATPTFFLNGEKMTFVTFDDFIYQVSFAIDPSIGPMQNENGEAGTSGVKFGL